MSLFKKIKGAVLGNTGKDQWDPRWLGAESGGGVIEAVPLKGPKAKRPKKDPSMLVAGNDAVVAEEEAAETEES